MPAEIIKDSIIPVKFYHTITRCHQCYYPIRLRANGFWHNRSAGGPSQPICLRCAAANMLVIRRRMEGVPINDIARGVRPGKKGCKKL